LKGSGTVALNLTDAQGNSVATADLKGSGKVASHTGVAKEILIFQISAVAPTEYLESDDVFSWFQIVCSR